MARPEDNVNFIHVAQIPSEIIFNYSYDVNKQREYMGHAVKGTTNSQAVWTVRHYTYDVNKQLETERIAYNIAWDDRATATYS